MKRAALLAVLCACSGGAEIAESTRTIGAGRYHVTIEGRGSSIVLRRGDEKLLELAADGIELGVVDALDDTASYDPWALEQRGEDAAGVTYRAPAGFALAGDGVDLDYGDGLRAHLAIGETGEGTFSLSLAIPQRAALVRLRARTSADPREGFYGLGEWENSVDHRGQLRAMQLEPDSTLESSYNEAHVPVPFLTGTHGWGIFAASRRVGTFDVARKDPAVVEVTFATAGDQRFDVALYAAETPREVLRRHRSLLSLAGSPRLPAMWAYGPWIWRNDAKDQAQATDDIATLRRLDLATSGIWIDRPYATAVNTFDFDPARYTDAKGLIDRAHAAGFRFALWSTPYLEAQTGALAQQAKTSGFYPPVTSLPLNPFGTPIDFTNPAAGSFWRGLVHRYTDMGVDGFKLDYGEDIAPSLGLTRNVWRFADGTDERTRHALYSADYHQAYSDALPADRFLLCRAAHWGEEGLGLVIWPGDMDTSFTKHGEHYTAAGEDKEIAGVGGLPATIAMGLSLSVSGFPFFGSDTGGYRHGPPDAELYTRWFEQTALSSVMQVGDGSSNVPWDFDAATVDTYRTFARLHLRLFPYAWSIASAGEPITVPLGFAHPELGVHPSDEYLFGDDLLVAPVVERAARTRHVIFPHGTWLDFWDATPYAADADVAAPLEKLPLFLREGAIVPLLRETIATLAPATDPGVESFANDPGVLAALVAPGPARALVLWDGTRLARAADGGIETSSGSVFTKGFLVDLVATPEPTEVIDDAGAPIPRGAGGWTWSPERRGTLRIALGPGLSHVRAR
jgi:alpha-D-xyloside xylohydrolase